MYVEQPKGYERKGEEHKVYKLLKALYGLKQVPRAWFGRIEAYFIKEGFQKSSNEHALFVKQSKEGKILVVSIYVDDLLFTGKDTNLMLDFKNSMKMESEVTDLGKMSFFLGIEVIQRTYGIFICQKKICC